MTMTVDGFVIGECLVGTDVGIVDYSRKERDEFGDITVIERGYTDYITYRVQIETSRADEVRTKLASVRAVLAAYVGTEKYVVTEVQGYLNNFTITLDSDTYSSLSLEVESELHA